MLNRENGYHEDFQILYSNITHISKFAVSYCTVPNNKMILKLDTTVVSAETYNLPIIN